MGRPEGVLEDNTVAAAVSMGALAYKFTSPGVRGVPDRIFVWPGAVIELVEFKSPRGRLSQGQVDVSAELLKRGVEVTVIDSYQAAVDWLHARWLHVQAWEQLSSE